MYRDSILNYIPYDPLYEEWVRSNITFIIDQRVPPTGWSYKGHIPDPYHPKHVWENALKEVQVYWSRSSVMMSWCGFVVSALFIRHSCRSIPSDSGYPESRVGSH